MDFKYSIELSAEEAPTGGMAGMIPVRRSRYPLQDDIGAIRAQQDWRRLVGPAQGYNGTLSPLFGLIQVAIPECRPERLEAVSYACELGFLYDDHTEFLGQAELDHANDNMQATFDEGIAHGKINSPARGVQAMQSILFEQMAAIDPPRAIIAMKSWNEFLDKAAGRQHEIKHSSFEAYMEYRVLDVGEMIWFGLVTFGMALTVPDRDMSRLRELTRSCWFVLALQNDVCSYDKEYQAAQLQGGDRLINAVQIIGSEHACDVEAAKEICKQHINEHISTYQEVVQNCKDDESLSQDTRVYIESLLYALSGDAAWNLVAPRYNAKQRCNELQLSMLKHGVDAVLERIRCRFVEESSLIDMVRLTPGLTPAASPRETRELRAYQKYIELAS